MIENMQQLSRNDKNILQLSRNDRKHTTDVYWPFYTRSDTRASSESPPVWATATCASDGHPVIDEVAIHRHPASCNIGASLSGQLSVLRWGWVCSTLPHHLVTMLTSNYIVCLAQSSFSIISILSSVQMITESWGARDHVKWVWTVEGVTRCSSAWRPPHQSCRCP